ncbi:MAG: F0F1 ATP synthase subunit epsilon [Acidimicrobiia bacterium]
MPLDVEVVSAEEELFSGEANFVLARTVEGDIGILPGHAPLLAELSPYEVKVRTSSSDQSFSVEGGFMTVKDDKVIILADVGGDLAETTQ